MFELNIVMEESRKYLTESDSSAAVGDISATGNITNPMMNQIQRVPTMDFFALNPGMIFANGGAGGNIVGEQGSSFVSLSQQHPPLFSFFQPVDQFNHQLQYHSNNGCNNNGNLQPSQLPFAATSGDVQFNEASMMMPMVSSVFPDTQSHPLPPPYFSNVIPAGAAQFHNFPYMPHPINQQQFSPSSAVFKRMAGSGGRPGSSGEGKRKSPGETGGRNRESGGGGVHRKQTRKDWIDALQKQMLETLDYDEKLVRKAKVLENEIAHLKLRLSNMGFTEQQICEIASINGTS